MEIYQDMDKKKFFRAAVLDTEKVQETEWEVKEGALAKELIAKRAVCAGIHQFLPRKCYQNVKVSKSFVRTGSESLQTVCCTTASVCSISIRKIIREGHISERPVCVRGSAVWKKNSESLQEERIPLQEMLEEIRRISQLEGLTQPLEDYRQWLSDLQKIPAKEAEKARLLDTMQKLREESVLVWEQQKQEIQQKQEAKKAEIEAVQKTIWNSSGKRKTIPEHAGRF